MGVWVCLRWWDLMGVSVVGDVVERLSVCLSVCRHHVSLSHTPIHTHTHHATQRYRPNPVAAITEREFQLAKRVLASFDLVMITEHLKWENQTAYARGMLFGAAAGPDGGEEAVAAEARRRGLGAAAGGARLQHHNKAQGATERDESAVDAETLRDVWRQNRWDVMLYDYARSLRDARMAAFLEKGELPRSDGKACKAPVNDPGFLRDGVPAGADPARPLRDSVLFTAPQCENNDYAVLELDERLDFAW